MTSRSARTERGPDPLKALRRLSAQILSAADRRPRPWEGASPEQPIAEQVARWLYSEWYAVLHPAPIEPPLLPSSSLVSQLRAALPSGTSWDEGWVAVQASVQGRCVAGRPGETRRLLPGDFVNLSRPGLPAMPGDALAVTRRFEWVDPPSGFWTARSPAGEPVAGFVRLYWSVGPHNAAAVLRRVTSLLDAMGARYMLKCPARPEGYDRVDTLVVYLDRTRWPRAARALARVARGARTLLRRASPPLTRVLAPGLAFSEDPGRDESFGQSRCRALAGGVLALAAERPRRCEDGVAVLRESLRSAAIDPDRPWLKAAS